MPLPMIRSEGFRLDDFYIPPFELYPGEIIQLQLMGGGHYFEWEQKLTHLFSGQTPHPQIHFRGALCFADHIRDKGWKELFLPTTVGKYLRTHAKPTNMPLSIFPDDRLDLRTPISHLAGSPRRFLSIYAALSRSPGFIFDLVGCDPQGAERILQIVREYVDCTNSYGLLLDNVSDMEVGCDHSIKIKLI